MKSQISKTELSPDNGCVIDTKWTLGSLGYHICAAGKDCADVVKDVIRLPEIVIYDHVGFKGAYARTNLSFNYIGDFWNDRISCLIVVSGDRPDLPLRELVSELFDRLLLGAERKVERHTVANRTPRWLS